MDLYSLSREIYSHAVKMESMRKQLTKANLEIYNLQKENENLMVELEVCKEVMKDNGIVLRKDYEKMQSEGRW